MFWGEFLRRESVVVCLCYSFRFSCDVVGKNVLRVNVFSTSVFMRAQSEAPLRNAGLTLPATLARFDCFH